jgi:hypothetical protein
MMECVDVQTRNAGRRSGFTVSQMRPSKLSGRQGRMEIEYKQKGMRRQSGWVKYGGCLTEHPMTRDQGGNQVKGAFTQVATALLSLLVESDGQ